MSLSKSTSKRYLHEWKYRVYSKVKTTDYTQDQEGQIRCWQKPKGHIDWFRVTVSRGKTTETVFVSYSSGQLMSVISPEEPTGVWIHKNKWKAKFKEETIQPSWCNLHLNSDILLYGGVEDNKRLNLPWRHISDCKNVLYPCTSQKDWWLLGKWTTRRDRKI